MNPQDTTDLLIRVIASMKEEIDALKDQCSAMKARIEYMESERANYFMPRKENPC